MSSKTKKSTPRAVVTPMRISRGEDDEQLNAHENDVDRIPQSVTLWPAVNFDVCGRVGVTVRPLPSAAAVLDEIPGLLSPQCQATTDDLYNEQQDEFVRLVCEEGPGLSFDVENSRDYLQTLRETGRVGEAVSAQLSADVTAVRALAARHPHHRHRCLCVEDFLQMTMVFLQRVCHKENQCHSIHNMFTALAAVAGLRFWNGSDVFRHCHLFDVRVVSIPALRLYHTLAADSTEITEQVLAIAEVTNESGMATTAAPPGERETPSPCLTQLMGEMMAEFPYSAFGNHGLGFAAHGTTVQVAVLHMEAEHRMAIRSRQASSRSTHQGALYVSPSLDMLRSADRRVLLTVMSRLLPQRHGLT